MQLDRTHIAIRERNFLEIMDLALRMVRQHPRELLFGLLLGATPAALLNHALLYELVDPNAIWHDPATYSFWLAMFMALEAPFVTAPITLFLGQATFHDTVSARAIASDFFRSLPQMILLQGVLRCATALLFGFGLLLPYIFWPYLSEVILLERNPLLARRGGPMTTWRRSRNLHRHNGGDLFARWFWAVLSGLVVGGSVVWGLHSVVSHLIGSWPDELTIYRWYLPIAGWLIVGFFAVVRFLCYLDLRIRREGWEIELTMRAEAVRLLGGTAA